MKARMKDNLIRRYRGYMPDEYSKELGKFLKSIEEKEVNLIFINGDAFEENDNSWWLPEWLWDAI